MDSSDAISVLTFSEAEPQGEFCVNSPRRFFCKFANCSKSFLHTSSLYRHHRLGHAGEALIKKENVSVNSSNDSSCTNHNDSPISIEEEVLDHCQQQMQLAGQGALFTQFQALLETVPHADPRTIEHLKSFHRVLYRILAQATGNSEEGIHRSRTAQSKRSLPADPPLYLTNIFVPSADLSFHLNSLGPAQVEFSDEGETSPFKRAHCAEIDFSRSYSEDMVSHRWTGEHKTVTPRELAALPAHPHNASCPSYRHGLHSVSAEEAAQVSGSSRHDEEGEHTGRFSW